MAAVRFSVATSDAAHAENIPQGRTISNPFVTPAGR